MSARQKRPWLGIAHRAHEAKKCVYCGCTDMRACAGGCEWIVIFPHCSSGVCSHADCLNAFSEDCLRIGREILGRPNFQTISKV